MILLDPATYAHVPWAIGLQLIGWATANRLGASRRAGLWLGALAGTVMAVTREVTQAEYRWIEAYGHGLRRNMPDLAGFYLWQWNAHSIAETAAAIAAVVAIAWIGGRRKRRSSSQKKRY